MEEGKAESGVREKEEKEDRREEGRAKKDREKQGAGPAEAGLPSAREGGGVGRDLPAV